ncbi:flippase [Aliivibrio finisterrensis]|uniref:Flippase n=1 Tax=Aliivibrio finisterrensis TaxID=511998 RepID=A0A4Q5KIX2_9GAMM|nr:flippase [Aliivibrio finisterrensis]RYU46105.1 flippase [Aliivibrio finisterrensis]
MTHKVLNNVFIYIIERVVTIISGLLCFVMIAREFGPADLGALSTIQSASAALMFMVTLGLDRFIVKDLVEGKVSSKSIEYTATVLRFLGWSIYSIGLFLFIWHWSDNPQYMFLAGIESITAFFIHVIIVRYSLESKHKAKELSISLIISRGISLTYVFLAIIFKADLLITCLFLPIQSAIRLLLMVYFYNLNDKPIGKFTFNRDWARNNIKQAFPIMLSGAIFPVFMQADVLMISHYLDEAHVGLYSAPMKLIFQSSFIGVAIMSAIYPLLVYRNKNSESDFTNTAITVGRAMILLSITSSLILFFTSKYIIIIMFGSDYQESIDVMKILSIIVAIVIPSKLFSSVLIIKGLSKYELPKSIFAVLLNITLNSILIPLYSIEGAAISSVIAYIFSDLIFYFLFKKLSVVRYVIIKSIRGLSSPILTIKNLLGSKF